MTQANHKTKKAASPSKTSNKRSETVTISKKQIILGVVALLLLVNVLGFAAYGKLHASQGYGNTIYSTGETAAQRGVTIKVASVQPETDYVMGIKPDETEKIISAQVTIANNSGTDYEFYPSAQTFIRDNQGTQYIMTPVSLGLPFVATTIKPGQTKTGQLSYLVTNRAVPLFLYFESRQADAGPIVFKIQ